MRSNSLADAAVLAETVRDLVQDARCDAAHVHALHLDMASKHEDALREARKLRERVDFLEEELQLGLQILQEREAEASQEKARANALEEKVKECQRPGDARLLEEENEKCKKDLESREAECERKLLAAEKIFDYCSKRNQSFAWHMDPATVSPRSIDRPVITQTGSVEKHDQQPSHQVEWRSKAVSVQDHADHDALPSERAAGDAGKSVHMSPLESSILSPHTPASTLATPLQEVHSPNWFDGDAIKHWRQILGQRKILFEQLEAEVCQREEEKWQLISDVAGISSELLDKKSLVNALHKEISELEAEKARLTRDMDQMQKTAEQEMQEERKKLLEGWVDEMRKERVQREEKMEEERASWSEKIERMRKETEYVLQTRDGLAEEAKQIQTLVSKLKSEEEALKEGIQRMSGLQILRERTHREEIAKLKQSIETLKMEENYLQKSLQRQQYIANEIEKVLILRETKRVSKMSTLNDVISQLRIEHESLNVRKEEDRRMQQEAARCQGWREAEESRGKEGVSGGDDQDELRHQIAKLSIENKALRASLRSRIRGEEEVGQKNSSSVRVHEIGRIVQENTDQLEKSKNVQGGSRGRDIKEVLTELLRDNPFCDEQNAEDDHRPTAPEHSMEASFQMKDAGFMTLDDLSNVSSGHDQGETRPLGPFRCVIQSLQDMDARRQRDKAALGNDRICETPMKMGGGEDMFQWREHVQAPEPGEFQHVHAGLNMDLKFNVQMALPNFENECPHTETSPSETKAVCSEQNSERESEEKVQISQPRRKGKWKDDGKEKRRTDVASQEDVRRKKELKKEQDVVALEAAQVQEHVNKDSQTENNVSTNVDTEETIVQYPSDHPFNIVASAVEMTERANETKLDGKKTCADTMLTAGEFVEMESRTKDMASAPGVKEEGARLVREVDEDTDKKDQGMKEVTAGDHKDEDKRGDAHQGRGVNNGNRERNEVFKELSTSESKKQFAESLGPAEDERQRDGKTKSICLGAVTSQSVGDDKGQRAGYKFQDGADDAPFHEDDALLHDSITGLNSVVSRPLYPTLKYADHDSSSSSQSLTTSPEVRSFPVQVTSSRERERKVRPVDQERSPGSERHQNIGQWEQDRKLTRERQSSSQETGEDCTRLSSTLSAASRSYSVASWCTSISNSEASLRYWGLSSSQAPRAQCLESQRDDSSSGNIPPPASSSSSYARFKNIAHSRAPRSERWEVERHARRWERDSSSSSNSPSSSPLLRPPSARKASRSDGAGGGRMRRLR